MLTISYDVMKVDGRMVLDIGCGQGRHTFESLKRGAHCVSADLDAAVLKDVSGMSSSMKVAGEFSTSSLSACVGCDVTRLPFADNSFDRVIASEVLEHVEDDSSAAHEIARVLGPGGIAAVTVPRWWPERICWALSKSYSAGSGGHVRIYRASELRQRLRRAGLSEVSTHHAHALHSPYWWLKCLFSDENVIVRAYHRVLVWDIEHRPRGLRLAERALNPVMGKSFVIYCRKIQS